MASISVIVPVYNVEKYLERCIESILSQTYKDFEIVLIDDGSTDNSRRICKQYEKNDRIHLIQQSNQGLSAARNTGIDWVFNNLTSEWITFIDSDDWIHPRYLEGLYKGVREKNLKISYCKYSKVQDCVIDSVIEEINIEKVTPEKITVTHYLYSEVVCGKLFHKEVLKHYRFPVGIIHEDTFFTWRPLFNQKEIAYVPEELYYYYYRPGSIMHSKWNLRHLDVLQAYNERMKFFKENDYKKAYLCTVGVMIDNLLNAITNINRNFQNYTEVKNLRQQLWKLYKNHKNELNYTIIKKLFVYNMIIPIRCNIVPCFISKRKHVLQIWKKDGLTGIVKKIKENYL